MPRRGRLLRVTGPRPSPRLDELLLHRLRGSHRRLDVCVLLAAYDSIMPHGTRCLRGRRWRWPKTRLIESTAIHEAGHSVMGVVLRRMNPVGTAEVFPDGSGLARGSGAQGSASEEGMVLLGGLQASLLHFGCRYAESFVLRSGSDLERTLGLAGAREFVRAPEFEDLDPPPRRKSTVPSRCCTPGLRARAKSSLMCGRQFLPSLTSWSCTAWSRGAESWNWFETTNRGSQPCCSPAITFGGRLVDRRCPRTRSQLIPPQAKPTLTVRQLGKRSQIPRSP